MLVVILVNQEKIKVVTDGFQLIVADQKYVMCNTCARLL